MSSITLITGLIAILIVGFNRSRASPPACTPPPLSNEEMAAYVEDAVHDNRTLFTSLDKILKEHNLPPVDSKCIYEGDTKDLNHMLSCSNGVFDKYYAELKQNNLFDKNSNTYKELEAAVKKWSSGTVPAAIPYKDIPFLPQMQEIIANYFPDLHYLLPSP